MAHPALRLLRVLMPSWKFFDDHDHHLGLFVRSGPAADTLMPYRRCLAPRPPGRGAPIFDPGATQALAERTALEELMALAAGGSQAKLLGSAPHVMVRRLAIRESGAAAGTHLQFKVCVRPDASDDWEDAVVSAVFTVGDAER